MNQAKVAVCGMVKQKLANKEKFEVRLSVVKIMYSVICYKGRDILVCGCLEQGTHNQFLLCEDTEEAQDTNFDCEVAERKIFPSA